MPFTVNKEIVEYALKGMRAEAEKEANRYNRALYEIQQNKLGNITKCKLSLTELEKIKDDAKIKLDELDKKIFDLSWEISIAESEQ